MFDRFSSIVLVLGGAYQAGGYAALGDAGLDPDWVVGASTGAINGAIIAGNAPENRVTRLNEYWRPSATAAGWAAGEDTRRSAAVAMTLAGGQPHVFAPKFAALPWAIAGALPGPSLYDTHPLAATLARLVDFDRLNGGDTRFTATAVDLETGEPATFDTRDARVAAEHIRASSALLPAFPPVEVDGRLLADGGLAANLPVDVVLSDPPPGRVLCVALDLLPLAAPRPATLGQAMTRTQDLLFAAQSRLILDGWVARAAAGGATPPVTVLHLAYDGHAVEVAGKAFDFSPASVRHRWDAGYAAVAAALAAMVSGDVPVGECVTVWRPAPGG